MNSFLISLFLTCLVSSFADFEIDTQAALTTDQFVCLAGQNFGMFTGRVYDPAGFIDETGIQNLKNAYQASGFYIYAYMSPCVSGNCQNNLTSAVDQFYAVFDRMNQEFHEVPLLVLIERGNWSTNQAQNQQFLMDLLKLIHSIFNAVGVITSESAWTSVFGNSFTNASSFTSLSWVNWNGKPDFSDFTPFGGWNKPSLHQYAGGVTTNNCTQGLPLDYTYYSDGVFARTNAQMAKRRSARLHKFARN